MSGWGGGRFRLLCDIASILVGSLTIGRKTMTEGEVIEAAAAVTANSITMFTIFITFTFGFLASAYFVGGKLTRFQALAATGLYVVAAGFSAVILVGWMQAFFCRHGS